MTYALREARARAAHALAAPIPRVIALIALAALGLSGDSVHEPVHAPRLRPRVVATLRDCPSDSTPSTFAALPFIRSPAPCTVGTSCANGARHGTDCTRCAGIIQSAVPRTVPRGRQAGAHAHARDRTQ
jgi:hypothetical protein